MLQKLNAKSWQRLGLFLCVPVLTLGLFLGLVTNPAKAGTLNGGWTSPLSSMPGVAAGFLANECGQPGYGGYISGNYHIANDYMVAAGTAVYAIGPGNVVAVQSNWPGSAVFVKHTAADGRQFLAVYGHLSNAIANGSTVTMGQQVGTIHNWPGNSHLHFGIRDATVPATSNNGNMPCSSWPATNGYVDPMPFLAAHPRVNPAPTDSDGDGTPNTSDPCPNVAGPALNSGCPFYFSLTEQSMASGDFDNDGYQDVAFGAAGEDIGVNGTNNVNAGMVHIVYGTANGPDASRQNRLTQAGLGGSDVVTLTVGGIDPNDAVGAALATGDFNGDGYDDLALGAPGENISGTDATGLVHVIYGSGSGLAQTSNQQVLAQHGFTAQGVVNLAGSGIEPDDLVGAELAAGDIDGDGYTDLLVGAPGEDIGVNGVAYSNAGVVHVVYGSATGFSARQHMLSQGGLTGTGIINTSGGIETGDYFGAALAVADFNKDGKADIVVGNPGEDIGAIPNAGFVNLLFGSANGPVAATQKTFAQNGYTAPENVPLIHGGADSHDYVGITLAAGDINGDTYPDLVIGASGEDVGVNGVSNPSTGVVHVVYNLAGNFTTSSTQQMLVENGLTGNGIVNTVVGGIEANDLLGSSLEVGDVDGDGYADLIAGSPGEGIGINGIDNPFAGIVHVVYGSSTGIGTRQQVLSQHGLEGAGIVNLMGGVEPGDFVGTDLLLADLDNDGKQDLFISASGEDLGIPQGSFADAGYVHLLYGDSGGFGARQASFSQSGLEVQGNINLFGSIEAGDRFGGGQPDKLFW